MTTVGKLYLNLSEYRFACISYIPFFLWFKFWHHKITLKISPLSLFRLNKILEITICLLVLNLVSCSSSNNIYIVAEHFSLSFIFCSYHSWQKYDFELNNIITMHVQMAGVLPHKKGVTETAKCLPFWGFLEQAA